MVRPTNTRRSDPRVRRRRAAMKRCAAEGKIDALLVSRPVDVRYLSGFTGDDSMLLVGGSWASLITDGRFAEQATAECGGIDVHVRLGSLDAAVSQQVRRYKVRRLAIQDDHTTVRGRRSLAEKLPSKRIRGVCGVVPALRMTKDAEEVRRIVAAVRVAERAFRELIAGGARALVGKTERQVAATLDYRMRLAGADSPSFETIVAAGPHASLPHYRPGSAVIRRGQEVLIDWGAKVRGYCSDLTRVVMVGRIPPKVAEIYGVVLRAQQAAMTAVRLGAACKTPDAAARKVIADAGYGEAFVHGLGHGVGLEIHEGPSLSRTQTRRLRSGMVVTVEPGVYLPGVGGVRIEDDVLVTAEGPRRLSSLPRTLAAMVLR